MTNEGPPLTMSVGNCESGQFSILIICRLAQRASSNGRKCRLGLSFIYNDDKFSNVPNVYNNQIGILLRYRLAMQHSKTIGHNMKRNKQRRQKKLQINKPEIIGEIIFIYRFLQEALRDYFRQHLNRIVSLDDQLPVVSKSIDCSVILDAVIH